MQVRVIRNPYFQEVECLNSEEPAAWEEALDLWAVGLARCLALTEEAASQEGGGKQPRRGDEK